MVDLVDKVTPSSASNLRINVNGKYLIPTMWLYHHYWMGNLRIVRNTDSTRKAGMLYDVLLDLISDFQLMGNPYDNTQYLLLNWIGDKRWISLNSSPNLEATLIVFSEELGFENVITRYNSQYVITDDQSIQYTGGSLSEFLYNRKMLKYFQKWLPIDLASFNPVTGKSDCVDPLFEAILEEY